MSLTHLFSSKLPVSQLARAPFRLRLVPWSSTCPRRPRCGSRAQRALRHLAGCAGCGDSEGAFRKKRTRREAAGRQPEFPNSPGGRAPPEPPSVLILTHPPRWKDSGLRVHFTKDLLSLGAQHFLFPPLVKCRSSLSTSDCPPFLPPSFLRSSSVRPLSSPPTAFPVFYSRSCRNAVARSLHPGLPFDSSGLALFMM